MNDESKINLAMVGMVAAFIVAISVLVWSWKHFPVEAMMALVAITIVVEEYRRFELRQNLTAEWEARLEKDRKEAEEYVSGRMKEKDVVWREEMQRSEQHLRRGLDRAMTAAAFHAEEDLYLREHVGATVSILVVSEEESGTYIYDRQLRSPDGQVVKTSRSMCLAD